MAVSGDVRNVLLVGVGGQGTILVSRILSQGLIDAGYDVKMSEVHGMAQRGGSVTTHVRFGSAVRSPILVKASADYLVSFETMEALRYVDYLKPDGVAIVNEYRIPSAPILMGKADYPADALDTLRAGVKTVVLRAADIATSLGNAKAMNIVLFGALVNAMKLDNIDWEAQIARQVKPATLQVNLEAFRAGRKAGAA